MYRGLLLACSVVFMTAAVVSADIPLPKNLKYIEPRVRFEGTDKLQDHVFYVRYLTFTGSPLNVPHTLVEVKNSSAFVLKMERRLGEMHLLALERKDFDKRKADDSSLKWLTEKAAGVMAVRLANPPTTGPADVKEHPTTTYRVTLKDGKLAAEIALRDKPKTDATPGGLLPLWVFGLVGAISLAYFGVWAARRHKAKPA